MSNRQSQNVAPKPIWRWCVPLDSWAEIIAAFDEPHGGKHVFKNDQFTHDKIRKLNGRFDGPIKFQRGRGKQPSVGKAALLSWWASLKDQYVARNEKAERKADLRCVLMRGQNWSSGPGGQGRFYWLTEEVGFLLKITLLRDLGFSSAELLTLLGRNRRYTYLRDTIRPRLAASRELDRSHGTEQ